MCSRRDGGGTRSDAARGVKGRPGTRAAYRVVHRDRQTANPSRQEGGGLPGAAGDGEHWGATADGFGVS